MEITKKLVIGLLLTVVAFLQLLDIFVSGFFIEQRWLTLALVVLMLAYLLYAK